MKISRFIAAALLAATLAGCVTQATIDDPGAHLATPEAIAPFAGKWKAKWTYNSTGRRVSGTVSRLTVGANADSVLQVKYCWLNCVTNAHWGRLKDAQITNGKLMFKWGTRPFEFWPEGDALRGTYEGAGPDGYGALMRRAD